MGFPVYDYGLAALPWEADRLFDEYAEARLQALGEFIPAQIHWVAVAFEHRVEREETLSLVNRFIVKGVALDVRRIFQAQILHLRRERDWLLACLQKEREQKRESAATQ